MARFREICRQLAAERRRGGLPFKYFTCYASVNALDDDESLELARQAGCIAMFVGFESINPQALREMGKGLNIKYGVESYRRLVQKAKRHGLLIVGEMMVGNDADDEATLRETERFIEAVGFDILRLQVVQPLPGTRLYARLEKEGRLLLERFPEDWDKLRDGFLVGVNFKLKQLDARTLQRWVKRVGLRFYSPRRIAARALANWRLTGSWRFGATTAALNWKSRKSYANLDVR